jgi:hypothetical protein
VLPPPSQLPRANRVVLEVSIDQGSEPLRFA